GDARRPLCRPRVRCGADRRAAAVGRPVRRTRRVPHLRLRWPDVQPADPGRDRRHRRARRLRVHRSMSYPHRIVCLTEETTETLYLLGQGDRVVGVSGYTVRPPEARQKPKISAFINAKFDKIVALHPDLVLAFSDLQADLVAELVRRGMNVVVFNQRSVDEIFQMIRMLGGLVGCQHEAEALADRFRTGLEAIRESAARFPRRPRVFFEEWDEPLISGIRWVEELVEIAGGTPIFPELTRCGLAK